MKFDEKEFDTTRGFDVAVKRLMKEIILMMRKVDPENKDCWVIGTCRIENLAESNGLVFQYGGFDDQYLKTGADFIIEVPL